MSNGQFNPKIVGFLCTWCSYTGADLAGTSRIKYPQNVTVIRTMCSGRVDPKFVLKAFASGADGVIVMGCHPGDCHYVSGNYKTMARIPLLRNMIKEFGIEPERLELQWVSAAEGDRFAEVITGFVEKIKEMGPLSIPGQIVPDVQVAAQQEACATGEAEQKTA